jgi:hypothetical protein
MEARTVCNTTRQVANYTLFYDRGRKFGNMYGIIRKLPKIYEYLEYGIPITIVMILICNLAIILFVTVDVMWLTFLSSDHSL